MKKIIAFVLVAFSYVAFGQADNLAGTWMPVTVKWQHAPANVDPDLSTASTSLLYFQPDGKVGLIGCVVYRRFGHHSVGAEGGTVAVGEWHREHGKIFIRSRVVYRPVPKAGEDLPGPWVNETLTPKDGLLLIKGVPYHRVADLDKGARELMPQHNQP